MSVKHLKLHHKPMSREDKVFNVVLCVLMAIVLIICAYPVYFVILASVSDSTAVNSGRLLLWVEGFHTSGYEFALSDYRIPTGYMNTLIYTVCGTILGLAACLPCAYALSRKDLPGRGILMALLVFTMYFGGGMIPMFIVVRTLNLTDTRWIMIILGSVSVYNIILIRTFFSTNIATELQ